MTAPRLTLRAIRAIGVEVPMKLPLGTSAGTIRSAPLLLIDLQTEEGVTGRAYLFCYLPAAAPAIAAILGEVERTVKGERVAPTDLWERLSRRFRLIGVQGIVRMALSGFDVACWDALAVAAEKPLVEFLGGSPRPVVAYNSNGLGLMAPEAAADEAEALLQGGFGAVKLRLGHPTLEADLTALRAVRRRLPERVKLMVDFNQALSLAEALRRGRAIDAEGIYWIEEPLRHDDFRGCAVLAQELATPVQIGENFSLPEQMAEALAAKACDCVMPDLERIGGVTGWLRAARLAAEHQAPMSSHLFPEASAHLLAITPTCHFLEYVDWASAILAEPLAVAGGAAIIPDRPGTGVEWDEHAVKHYRMA
ncbi:MAG: enolase C-terminal domain-like protein [Burkholderiales bacterium]